MAACTSAAAGPDEATDTALSSSSSSLPASHYLHQWPGPLTTTSSSTSLPQLQSARVRSKVYRRASLKAFAVPGPQLQGNSKIVRMSGRGRVPEAPTGGLGLEVAQSLGCDPLASPCRYSSPCQRNKDEEEEDVEETREQKRAKPKSCVGFLPMLSLIPHTLISFQYPSPKMKFSWWRNKIS